jgi:flagellar basal-body rod protein FlgB
MIQGLFSNTSYAASKQMLDVTQLRHEALASNIANTETPGYKRVDLPASFNQDFAAHLRSGELSGVQLPALAQDPTATSQRLDGNNVEIDKELLQMGSNSVQYETLTEFVSNSLKQLKVAVSGQP